MPEKTQKTGQEVQERARIPKDPGETVVRVDRVRKRQDKILPVCEHGCARVRGACHKGHLCWLSERMLKPQG